MITGSNKGMKLNSLSPKIFLTLILFPALAILSTPARALQSAPPYIVWWGNAKPLLNLTMVAPGAKEDMAYWRALGVINAGHVGIGPAKLGYADKGHPEVLRRQLEERAAEGYDAITLEIERKTDKNDAAVLEDFKRAHPNIFISAWLLGFNNRHPYARLKESIDLFMYEVYIEYGHPFVRFDQYVKMAGKEGILDKSIFAISVVTVNTIDAENQLRYIRKLAPSMPGIAFFYYRGWGNEYAVDALSKKYFLNPVLEIRPGDLSFSRRRSHNRQIVTLKTKVRNIGYQPGSVAVEFYDGANIIKKVGPRTVKARTSRVFYYRWRPSPGKHKVFARLTPNIHQPLLDYRQARTTIDIK